MDYLNPRISQDIEAFKDDWKDRDLALATLRSYERHLRRAFAHAVTLRPESAVTEAREHLRAFDSKHEARMAARALRAFGKWYATEYETENPFARLKLPREPQTKPTTIATGDEIEAMLAACKASMAEDRFLALRDHAIISVLRSTGCRRSELARMKWEDLDEDTKTIVLPKTKNGEARLVVLSPVAWKSLRRYRYQVESWVTDMWVTATMRTLSSNAVLKMLSKRSHQAGVKLSAHSFRRGFAVEWLRAGGSETYLRTVAGWRSPAMVGRYVKTLAEENAVAEYRRLFG